MARRPCAGLQPGEQIAELPSTCLSAPQIQGPYHDRSAFESTYDFQVGRQMLFLVRRIVPIRVEKLGPVQANPNCSISPDGYRSLREVEIAQQTYRGSIDAE